jgi:2-phospho-L-lactate guanylyltransferase
MSIWAIVPIKPLNRAKSRLTPALNAEARQQLALGMLLYNLHILTSSPLLAGVMVISRDTKALARARQWERVQTLQESGTPELNAALQRASKMLIAWGAEAALILPADVPLCNREDIEQMIQLGAAPNSIVIAPDRHHDGTNAIFTRPPNLIPFSFGVGSFKMHLQHNSKSGLTVQVYESERLGLDIDTPDDLAAYHDLAAQLGVDPIPYDL